MVQDSPSLAQASFPLRELGRQETFSEPSECHRQESSPCQLFRLYCKSHQLQPYCELPKEPEIPTGSNVIISRPLCPTGSADQGPNLLRLLSNIPPHHPGGPRRGQE